MKNVLIVEDDGYKLSALSDLVKGAAVTCSIHYCRSVQSAVAAVRDVAFDIVILDMSLPSHDIEKGSMLGIPRLSGGIEVLFELDYIGSAAEILIVTQYPEIEMSGELVPLDEAASFIHKKYGIPVVGCVYYDPDGLDWKAQFSSAIKEIATR